MSPVTAKENNGKAVLDTNKATKGILCAVHYYKDKGMVLAVNIMHGRGPSNKMCPQ